jgi:hypothetical protein
MSEAGVGRLLVLLVLLEYSFICSRWVVKNWLTNALPEGLLLLIIRYGSITSDLDLLTLFFDCFTD